MNIFDDTMMILDDDEVAFPTNNDFYASQEEEALYGDVDIIMQLDSDEGLLPDLNDDCLESDHVIFSSRSLENDILYSSSKPTRGGAQQQLDVVSVDDNNSGCDDSDSFLSSSAQQKEDELDTSCHSSASSSASSYSSSPSPSPASPYFSSPSDKAQFQGMLAHLSEAMQRSRQSRHSLYYFGPYPLSQHGQAVLSHVEYSSQQVDSYARALRM